MFQGVSREEVNVTIAIQLDVSGRFEGRNKCSMTA